jgi:hypothetical protein
MAYLGKSPSQGVRNRYYFTASGGETSISGALTGGTLTFTDGNYVDVNLNGVTLVAGTDYNTSTANTIAGLSALTASDVVEIVVYDVFSVFSGNVNSDFSVGGNLSVTGTTAFTGATTITGLTTTGDINFGDNDKAIFGASSDLQISHTGAYSLIADSGTGNLILACEDFALTNPAVGENMITAAVDGAVTLFYDNSAKLFTTSSGVSVTGGISATDGSTITTADNSTQLTLVSTDADASNGPRLDLKRDSASPADGDTIGRIRFMFDNDAAEQIEGVRIDGHITDASDGTEDTSFNISTVKAGSLQQSAKFGATETVFNESSLDLDFRVESLGDANSFVVEGATKGIGMGTNDPTIDGTLAGVSVSVASRVLHIHDDNGAYLKLSDPASGSNRGAQFAMIGTDAILNNCESGRIIFGTGNTERMRLDSSGNVLIAKTALGTENTGVEIGGSSASGGGFLSATRNNAGVLFVNRGDSDGTVVNIMQDNNSEGSISVSGSTVSYNGGHLARWSQATDGNRIDGLLKGTVMTNLDQMAEWSHAAVAATYYTADDELPDGVSVGDEKTQAVAAYDEDNEQLNCMAVSSVEGDPNVAGVFVNWDDDDEDYTADMNVAMTGDMIIRIAQGTTVARGDLLMSAGDGTAKPQGDDIVRSKTIAKVTSTNVSHTYDDGSYCVPCVLMAC